MWDYLVQILKAFLGWIVDWLYTAAAALLAYVYEVLGEVARSGFGAIGLDWDPVAEVFGQVNVLFPVDVLFADAAIVIFIWGLVVGYRVIIQATPTIGG